MDLRLATRQLAAAVRSAGRMPVSIGPTPPGQMPFRVPREPYVPTVVPFELVLRPPPPPLPELGDRPGTKIYPIPDRDPVFGSTVAGAGVGATTAVGLGGN